MTSRSVVERILFVAGAPDAGKSHQLRAMFLDPGLGAGGRVLEGRKPAETYDLSAARRLFLKLMSPQESGISLDEFVDLLQRKTVDGRWNIACASQIAAGQRCPGLVSVVSRVSADLRPERIRVALLSPTHSGGGLPDAPELLTQLLRIDNCEVMCVDGRSDTGNALLLADTFDFS